MTSRYRLAGLSLLGAALALWPGPARAETCRRPAIHVHKLEGELILTCAGQPRHRFPVSFGGEPLGHKTRSGDQRTPEGAYVICGTHRSKRFYKFLSVSYPGPGDAERGLRQKVVSRAQHAAIVAAHRAGRCPPFGTRLGGAIGIHGLRNNGWALTLWNRLSRIGNLHRRVGFSDGCIMLSNDHVDILWRHARRGTPVFIHGAREATRATD